MPYIRSLITESNPLIKIPWRDPDVQMQFILEDPFNLLRVLWNTFFISQGTFYLNSFVGVLGWLDNPLPQLLINSYMLVLLVNSFINKPIDLNLSIKDRAVILMIFLFSIFAIEMAIYLTWTPPGSSFVQGVQGRYFIPLAPLFFMMFFNTIISNKIVNLGYYYRKAVSTASKNEAELSKDFANERFLLNNYGLFFLCLFIVCTLIITAVVICNKYYYV